MGDSEALQKVSSLWVGYSTVRNYALSSGMAMVDFTAIHKLVRTFDILIEDLVEILEE
ncbi:hypothetical protein [Coleofasciculus sp. H7-2]|uniref:hypothetical protein n=1 Tax=Coleofasciculus sp. H7-2 TaxID=3351545 RepID=UPI00366A5E8A